MGYYDERLLSDVWLAIKFVFALIIIRIALHVMGIELNIPVLDSILDYFVHWIMRLKSFVGPAFEGLSASL